MRRFSYLFIFGIFFLIWPSLVSAEYYPGLDPDFFTSNQDQLGYVAPGKYACAPVSGNTPKQEASNVGRVIRQQCAGQVTKTWVPSRVLRYFNRNNLADGYWMICCEQRR